MQNLKSMKTKYKGKGYNEEHFKEDYWTGNQLQKMNTTRACRDFGSLLRYFQDLFKFIKNKNSHIDINKFTILDVGAGAGAAVNQFRKANLFIEGCEFSMSGRNVAKRMYNIDLNSCDLRSKLSYDDNEFDWSMCVGVLSMIPKTNMCNAVSELLRVTKYGVVIHTGTGGHNASNLHHITAMPKDSYTKVIKQAGSKDWTSRFPPQADAYGIGVMDTDFTKLISKMDWPFNDKE